MQAFKEGKQPTVLSSHNNQHNTIIFLRAQQWPHTLVLRAQQWPYTLALRVLQWPYTLVPVAQQWPTALSLDLRPVQQDGNHAWYLIETQSSTHDQWINGSWKEPTPTNLLTAQPLTPVPMFVLTPRDKHSLHSHQGKFSFQQKQTMQKTTTNKNAELRRQVPGETSIKQLLQSKVQWTF